MSSNKPFRVKWACPKCSAKPNGHGKGPCLRVRTDTSCSGFLCECSVEALASGDNEEPVEDEALHGITYQTVCPNAHCYHCGWRGAFPKQPKGLEPWEKKALSAGWSPPEVRRRELQLGGKKVRA